MNDLPGEKAAINYEPGPIVSHATQIKDRHEGALLNLNGVTGVGVGKSETGIDVIIVYVRDAFSVSMIPSQIEGVPVHTEVTGDIDAY